MASQFFRKLPTESPDCRDERDIADLVGFNLEPAGYQVLRAHDGITGARMAIHQRPDLVILDRMLPGRDGFGLLKEIRRDSRSLDIPVILLSSRARTGDRIARRQKVSLRPLCDNIVTSAPFAGWRGAPKAQRTCRKS